VTQALEYYRTLPRAARWSLIALAFVLAYFVVVEPALDRYNALQGRANKQAAVLVSFRATQQQAEAARAAVATGISRFGEVYPPGEPEARAEAFNRKVAEVLARHDIRNQRTTTRSAPLSRGPLVDSIGQGVLVMRLTNEIQFDGTPEQVSAVVADLEACPEVAGVSRVQVRRSDEERARAVRATIAAETWLLARKAVQP
jgi:hypothetical protein